MFFIFWVQNLLGESGQIRGQFGHARTASKSKNISKFKVSRAASAGANVDKSGQFFREPRERLGVIFLDFNNIGMFFLMRVILNCVS